MSAIIDIEDLSFAYASEYEGEDAAPREVLHGIDLSIEEGSFVVIMGENGSGKSTLAKCMNSLLIPTSGSVRVLGMDTADEDHIWDIRSAVGMVFQNPDNQIVSTIVEDDVAFGPENIGVPPDEIRQRVDRALKDVGLYEMRTRASHTLSGGQKQRQAVAGVLAMEPRCVIFDESTAMLDPQGRKDILDIISDLHERSITVILITHYMEEAAGADRIIIMNRGRITADDTPERIFADEDKIRSAGLELPRAVSIRNALRSRGLEIPDRVTGMNDLASYILKAGGLADAD